MKQNLSQLLVLLRVYVSVPTVCTYECVPGLRVDSNEAGTLLVGFGPHAFDQFEWLPVDEGTILLSPLYNIPRPACI